MQQEKVQKDDDSSSITPPPKRGLGSQDFSQRGGFSGKSAATYNDNQQEYSDLIDTMIQNDRENSDDKGIEGARIYMKKLMGHSSTVGQIYDWSLVIISIASCLMYIASTYVPERWTHTTENIYRADVLFSVIFLLDIVLNLWLADQRSEFFFSVTNLIAVASVIPVWIIYQYECPTNREAVGTFNITIYIIHALKTTVILRPIRIQKKIKEIPNEVQRSIGEMTLTIVLMIIFSKLNIL